MICDGEKSNKRLLFHTHPIISNTLTVMLRLSLSSMFCILGCGRFDSKFARSQCSELVITCTHSQLHAHTHNYTHALTTTRAHSQLHAHTHNYTHTLTTTSTHSHTQNSMHTRTHTRSHAHTHTSALISFSFIKNDHQPFIGSHHKRKS